MIINRFGDFAVYMAILLIFFTFKTFSFYAVFPLCYKFSDYTFSFLGFNLNMLTVIGSFLFLGAVGKSAQVGLHV